MSTTPFTAKRNDTPRRPLPFWLAEFSLIRNAVLVAIATVAVGLGLVILTTWRYQGAEADLQRVQRLRDTAHSRYAHVETEKRDIRNFQQRYVELRQRGLIGDERRIEWVDSIRMAQEELQLPPLSYEIDPQQPVKLESALDLGEYQLQGSRMRLHMELLHEGELFDFLGDLRARGFFAVQECSLKRLATSAAVAGAAAAPSLGADCTLNWITMTSAPPALPATAAAPVVATKAGGL